MPMPAALPAALLLLAQGAVAAQGASPQAASSPASTSLYGPAAPAPPIPPKAVKVPAADDSCAASQAGASSREIVICAQRPNGYRLDPDVMAARQHQRQQLAGRPKTPMEKVTDHSCVVGQGCFSAGINLVGAALTAAEMAARLSKGEEIGSMFQTERQPDEYQLYVAAKREREAKDAEQAALAKAKAQPVVAAPAAVSGAPPAPVQAPDQGAAEAPSAHP